MASSSARRRPPRVLTRDEALGLGYSRHAVDHRIATGSWRRILPGTYLTVDTLTGRDRVAAALSFAGAGAALSGAAALAESGVKGYAIPNRIQVLVPPENRRDSYEWVRIRRTFRPFAVESAFAPRRVRPARAAADLALDLRRIDDVRALVARVVGDRYCTIDELQDELATGPRQYSGLLRQALAEVDGGAASAPEARAARLLRRAGVAPFTQNARIVLPGGGYYIADFLWDDLKAILEIDSVEYHLGPAEWRATMDRHLALTTLGYSLVHRPPSALADARRFTTEISAWLVGLAGRTR